MDIFNKKSKILLLLFITITLFMCSSCADGDVHEERLRASEFTIKNLNIDIHKFPEIVAKIYNVIPQLANIPKIPSKAKVPLKLKMLVNSVTKLLETERGRVELAERTHMWVERVKGVYELTSKICAKAICKKDTPECESYCVYKQASNTTISCRNSCSSSIPDGLCLKKRPTGGFIRCNKK